jgi:hypothetical protein
VTLKCEKLIEKSRLNDQADDNVKTNFAELKAQITRKQEKPKTLQKAIGEAKAEQTEQKAAEIDVVRNHERQRDEMLSTRKESEKHRLNSTAKATERKHSSRRSTSNLGIALVERLELEIGHLQMALMELSARNAELVGNLKQGIQVMEDATKTISQANRKLMRTIRKTGTNSLSKEAK